ncbi:MAG: PP2C family protein-serine/threonine phosphatase [Acidobacteriota bacterium]
MRDKLAEKRVKKKRSGDNLLLDKSSDFLKDELKNFQEIFSSIKPSSGEFPEIDGIDIFGGSMPLNGIAGGDHIIYIDFNRRYDMERRIREAKEAGNLIVAEKLNEMRSRAGILIADVSGHKITDALMAAMLHQSFLVGVLYELDQYGEITGDLFENLNSRFYRSSSFSKFITMIYGEISVDGMFRFINAGHPSPVVFSNRFNKLIKVCLNRVVNFPPIGTLPSRDDIDSSRNFSRLGFKKKYSVNKINLMGKGDILLLFTDGLIEHGIEEKEPYFNEALENILRSVKESSAKDIFHRIKEDLKKYSEPSDDISFVVIKKKK